MLKDLIASLRTAIGFEPLCHGCTIGPGVPMRWDKELRRWVCDTVL